MFLHLSVSHSVHRGVQGPGGPDPGGAWSWGVVHGPRGCLVLGGAWSQEGVLVETPLPETAAAAGGTHPTGMHSCFHVSSLCETIVKKCTWSTCCSLSCSSCCSLSCLSCCSLSCSSCCSLSCSSCCSLSCSSCCSLSCSSCCSLSCSSCCSLSCSSCCSLSCSSCCSLSCSSCCSLSCSSCCSLSCS